MKLKRSVILAAIVVVLGLTVTCIPKFIFPICESGNLGFFSSYQPVMRCFWFGRIELFLGGLVVLSGLILLFRPTPDNHFAIGALLVGLGLVIMLLSFNAVIYRISISYFQGIKGFCLLCKMKQEWNGSVMRIRLM